MKKKTFKLCKVNKIKTNYKQFLSEVKIILLFYVNHESLIIKNKFKNNVLINLSKILSTQIEFHIINLNINEKEQIQIKCLEEQLKSMI